MNDRKMTKRPEGVVDSPPEGESGTERKALRLPLHLRSLQMSVRLICSLLLRTPSLSLSDEERTRLRSYAEEGF